MNNTESPIPTVPTVVLTDAQASTLYNVLGRVRGAVSIELRDGALFVNGTKTP